MIKILIISLAPSTNKVKVALNLFDTIQTLDREKLVDEIVKEKKIKQ